MAEIALESLTKVYPDGTHAVTNLDLDVASGEFLVFVGPSGCGKTTALRMIAGLETITSGKVTLGGQVINDLPPKDRDIAMVFQNYALYPHMNAAKNMGFPLKMRGLPGAEIEARVHEAARILGLEDSLHKKPRTLSGGQRQRVAMGRAIVRNPQAFLMDEPLSNLDAKLRVEMRAEIARLQRDLGVTTIYVTHDQTEAMTMGDRVAVMRNGFLQQIAAPNELYDRPRNLFVAEFIGSPAMNLVVADVEQANGAVWVAFGTHRLRLEPSALEKHPGLSAHEGRQVVLGIRPEDMQDASVVREPHPDRVIVRRLRNPRGHGLRGVRPLQRAGGSRGDQGSRAGARPRGRGGRGGAGWPPSAPGAEGWSSPRASSGQRAHASGSRSHSRSTSPDSISSIRRPESAWTRDTSAAAA